LADLPVATGELLGARVVQLLDFGPKVIDGGVL
jgi:hypothetical protein